MQLRPYQQDAGDTTRFYIAAHDAKALAVMPTATGEGLVAAGLVKRAPHDSSDMRVIALTHVRALIAHDSEVLRHLWPDAPSGICSAGVGRRDQPRTVAESIEKASTLTNSPEIRVRPNGNYSNVIGARFA